MLVAGASSVNATCLFGGVRLATTVMIALGTIAAKFGAGGLGVLLFEGIAQAGRYDKIWAGTIVVGLLAVISNGLLWLWEQQLQPKSPPA